MKGLSNAERELLQRFMGAGSAYYSASRDREAWDGLFARGLIRFNPPRICVRQRRTRSPPILTQPRDVSTHDLDPPRRPPHRPAPSPVANDGDCETIADHLEWRKFLPQLPVRCANRDQTLPRARSAPPQQKIDVLVCAIDGNLS